MFRRWDFIQIRDRHRRMRALFSPVRSSDEPERGTSRGEAAPFDAPLAEK